MKKNSFSLDELFHYNSAHDIFIFLPSDFTKDLSNIRFIFVCDEDKPVEFLKYNLNGRCDRFEM